MTGRSVSSSGAFRAAVWMLGAIFSFTAMAVAARALHGHHDTFEIMLFRSLFGMIVVLSVARYAGTLHEIKRRRIGLHVIRNLSHFIGQNLWFFAVAVAPLAQVFALEFTLPIWATLLAAIFLAEPLTRIRVLTAVVGFVGVLIVAQPWSAPMGDQGTAGLIAAGVAAIGFAGAAIGTRLLTRTETITCIMFYLTFIQAIFGIIAAGYDGQIRMPTMTTTPWLMVVGAMGLIAHFCMTKALSLAPAAVVMPVDFARLPIIALVGMAFYSEPLQWAVLGGAVVIFGSNYINIRAEAKSR